jgi:hypothetical protein
MPVAAVPQAGLAAPYTRAQQRRSFASSVFMDIQKTTEGGKFRKERKTDIQSREKGEEELQICNHKRYIAIYSCVVDAIAPVILY